MTGVGNEAPASNGAPTPAAASRRRRLSFPSLLIPPTAGHDPRPRAPRTRDRTRRSADGFAVENGQKRRSCSRPARSSRVRGRRATATSTCLSRSRVFSVVSNCAVREEASVVGADLWRTDFCEAIAEAAVLGVEALLKRSCAGVGFLWQWDDGGIFASRLAKRGFFLRVREI